MRKLIAQFARFGVVGMGGFVIDTGLFNLLSLTVFASLHEGPLLAKTISTIVAIAFNWVGNRLWTFREHRGEQLLREGLEFGIVSAGGLGITLGCLWISHYALGYTSTLADNISSNVIGFGLSTIFRFALYRLWVFRPHRGEPQPLFNEELPQIHFPRTGSLPVIGHSTNTAQTPIVGTAPGSTHPGPTHPGNAKPGSTPNGSTLPRVRDVRG